MALLTSSTVMAADHYVLLITGAAGGEEYALKYQSWRTALTTQLSRFGYAADHIVVLEEQEAPGIRQSTRENVKAALAELGRRTTAEDVVVVLLLGHGTPGGMEEPKFNLVGPDLTSAEWANLIKPIAGRLVFVNTTGGSFPFLQPLSAPGRIVITATASAAQEYETVFPDFFVRAFGEVAADLDKNGKVSIWEAFYYGTDGVRRWFEQRGQLPTERSLLDDTGDGVGREALDDPKSLDGRIAQVTYLQPDTVPAMSDTTEVGALMKRRAEVQAQVDLLRSRKLNLPEPEYQVQLERLLLELARLDRDIRSR